MWLTAQFEGSCFLADVSETSASREGLIQLQKILLSKILGGAELNFVNAHEGTSLIKDQLRQKKILLILDDVDKLERLKDWVDVDCFGEGSRVVITTKDKSLLDFYEGQWIYKVQKLEDDKALELFSWNAFKRNRPPDDYLSLAQRAIVHAQGLPLALNLIGSHLRNKSIDRWQAVLNSYDSYSGEPYTDIQIILRKTYDAWDCNLQQVFLDIACFFKGENKDYMLQMLRSSTLNVPEDIIDVLVEKAIIAIEYNRIVMHGLLEKMGKHIVYEESPTEPGKRSRLWQHKDVCDVLINCKGTKKIRGIVVNLLEPDEIPLNPKSFLEMVNLEFFINHNAHFSGCVDYLPNSLRLIEFGGRSNIDQRYKNVPFNFDPGDHKYVLDLPSNFQPRDLVSFDVSYSGIRQLKRFKNLAKLTWMKLSGCKFLKKIPDLSGSPNIKSLCLSGCKNLVEVDDSVGFLDKLEVLYLTGCSKLTRFPTRLGLRSLKELYFSCCKRLERFPEIEKDKMKSLTRLEIPYSGIRELPSSIAYLTGLEVLIAHYSKLQNVPDLSGSPNIEFLFLANCTSLVKLDDSVELQRVKFDEVSSRLCLDLSECNLSESDFLVPLYCWSALTELYLSRNNFVSLSDCISKAVNLKKLYLCDCKRLREIPVLPPKLEELYLDDCTSLDKIPKLTPRLWCLRLRNCSGLSGDEVAKLENNLLNEDILVARLENNKEFDPRTRLNIIYPGNEIPKWFSYTSNYPTTSQHVPEYEDDESDREFRFEIPLKLQVGETLLGLALSFVYEPPTCNKWGNAPITCIIIDGERRFEHYLEYSADIKATHVSLALTALRGLREQEQHGDICQVVFRFDQRSPVKSCGVHCLLRNQDSGSSSSEDGDSGSSSSENGDSGSSPSEDEEQEQEQPSDSDVPFDIEEDEEQLHLPLRPPSSLGKRPRPRGSSDIVDDAYDQQQQWLSSSSEPADDHPKRRQIDPNVPFDIEEDEKQEQPTASDDPQILIS